MTVPAAFVVSASARGAAHIRRGMPNQDFSGWEELEDGVFALAVADGHGAPLHARSADGARLAVEACLAEMRSEWAREAGGLRAAPIAGAQAILEGTLALWRDKVDAEIASHPLDAALAAESLAAGLGTHGPYGTTLVAALLWPEAGLAFQLGDGDLLIRDGADQIQRPIAADEHEGEETASLCEADAQAHARFAAIGPWKGAFLATDGFAKSFTDAEAMASAALLLLDRVAAGQARPPLEADLAALSARGSSDDISIAALVGAPQPGAPPPGMEKKRGWPAWIIIAAIVLVLAFAGRLLTSTAPAPGPPIAAPTDADPAKPAPGHKQKAKPIPRQAKKTPLKSGNTPGGNDAGRSEADPK